MLQQIVALILYHVVIDGSKRFEKLQFSQPQARTVTIGRQKFKKHKLKSPLSTQIINYNGLKTCLLGYVSS